MILVYVRINNSTLSRFLNNVLKLVKAIYLEMSDSWDEDGKAKDLVIPGMSLPGLRDLQVFFIALIEFDLFLGPVVFLNEISKGSSYIGKLKDYQTLSEVYAGVARADVDTLTTTDEVIALFRYDPEGSTDITTVFMISCMPGADLSPIRKIGGRALLRAKGKAENLGRELSTGLREFQSGAKEFERLSDKSKIKILTQGQIQGALPFQSIKGMGIFSLQLKYTDFRLVPQFYASKELIPDQLLNYFDLQYDSVDEGYTTSLLYKGIPLVLSKFKQEETVIFLLVDIAELQQITYLGDWLNTVNDILAKEWRFASLEELKTTVGLLDKAPTWHSIPEFLRNYVNLTLRSMRITPRVTDKDIVQSDPPEYISSSEWSRIIEFDGSKSLHSVISNNEDRDIYNIVKLLEWARLRNILSYVE